MNLKRAVFFLIVVGALFAADKRQEELDALRLPEKITGAGWNRIGVRDHYGVNVPLLSLHSKQDSGCGEFHDLFPLIDWLHALRMDILQLLPLNDTGPIASPYSPLSLYALHPIYLSLKALSDVRKAPDELWEILKELKAMNQTERVDYEKVLEKKTTFLEGYVSHFKESLMERAEYQEFMKSASYWITDYALYKVLVSKLGASWMKWPEEYQHPTPEKMAKLKTQFAEEMVFYQIVQSLCFEQMEKVHRYANQHGVFLLGDLTILVDTNSEVVWQHPDFFKIDFSVGVPPETGFPEGQYWGLPPYNWKVIEESQDPMLTQRIKCFSRLYDLYRLDSCLSYFAQFEIPIGKHPIQGAYVPANGEEAFASGKRILTSFIQAAPHFLPYAEAFAMSPKMYQLLEDFGIAKLKTYIGTNTVHSADDLLYNGEELPLLGFFMLSNHDNMPLQKWWAQHPAKATLLAKHYGWKYTRNLTTAQQKFLIQMTYSARPIFHVNMLYDLIPASLAYPPEKQGINVPGTDSEMNWTYRFKLSVEEITTNQLIRSLAMPSLKENGGGVNVDQKTDGARKGSGALSGT
ncbi:MAG: 4-alpha-glucanotransferase [Chlamydiia bacterium]|nr:4-alpha-glucanotransferase [Chlamydiia bacterium]